MKSRRSGAAVEAVFALGMAAAFGACGAPPAPPPIAVPPVPPRTVAVARPAPVAPAEVNPLEGAGDIPKYEVSGRRDPFEVHDVRSAAASLTVASTRLTGIIRNARSALALVEAPDGIGYILRPGDTLGDGTLTDIGLDNVVFAVVAKPGAPTTRVVLRLLAN